MSAGLNLEFAHAVVLVCDMERMVDFYTNVLGFEVTDRGPIDRPGTSTEIVFLSQTATHHHQLAFIGLRDTAGRSNSVDHLAFRTSGSLADLRRLKERLEATEGVDGIRPITHGNAWSVYFRDPEGNGVEVFLDTPWHVAQPQARPLDLSLDDAEIEAWTEASYRDEPRFGPIEQFYADRAEHLAR
jgi:catechol 2,3-dioxygenase-like lactoylglutathione lyase family enzyme